MKKDLSRRDLLKAMAAVAGTVGIWRLSDLLSVPKALPAAMDDTIPESVSSFLPLIHGQPGELPTSPPPPAGARVVHVQSSNATSWGGQTAYWDYVDQDKVNAMVDQGMMALTGTSSVAAAWQSLLPNYSHGQGIAIKANFNNSTNCSDADGQIDAIIEPINSIVRGLLQIGVRESDIWIYDAIRYIPDRFTNASQHAGVRFFDKCGIDRASFSSSDPNAHVTFNPPPGVQMPTIKISDVLINATYLINMPIMKPHGITGATLSFKNHFGTIDTPFQLHEYVRLSDAKYFGPDRSALVDIYLNPHIADKTILTIGDAIFACKAFNGSPSNWETFGDQVPNSLFFSKDPVAVDCVMCDFLDEETTIPLATNDYLQIAGNAGLGTFERGDPWGSGYNQIDYLRLNL